MSSEIKAFIAEFDEAPPGSPSSSAHDETRGVSMEFDIAAEISKRQAAIGRVLSRTDPAHIQAGIEAYKRDLPRLLGEDKACHVVAYDGGRRVGLARDLEELEQGLKRDGITDRSHLFIKHVAPLDDEGEHFRSNQR